MGLRRITKCDVREASLIQFARQNMGGVLRVGQCLHAKTLGFIHPATNEYIETDAPLPEYFSHLLNVLK